MQIFLGCTKGHEILHEVAANSFSRFTNDVNIRFLHLNALKQLGLYWRGQDKGASTEFTISVFILLYYLVSRAGVFFVTMTSLQPPILMTFWNIVTLQKL